MSNDPTTQIIAEDDWGAAIAEQEKAEADAKDGAMAKANILLKEAQTRFKAKKESAVQK